MRGVVAVCLLVGLAITGCSGSGEPTPTDTSAGQAGGDLVGWAGDVCVVQSMAFAANASMPPTPASDDEVASYVAALRELAIGQETAYQQASAAAASLQPAPVEGGDQITQQVQESFTTGAKTYQELVDSINAFDVNAPDATARAAALSQKFDDAYVTSSQAFNDALGSGKAMGDAFRTAPECKVNE